MKIVQEQKRKPEGKQMDGVHHISISIEVETTKFNGDIKMFKNRRGRLTDGWYLLKLCF